MTTTISVDCLDSFDNKTLVERTNARIAGGLQIPLVDRRNGQETVIGTVDNFRIEDGKIVCDTSFRLSFDVWPDNYIDLAELVK